MLKFREHVLLVGIASTNSLADIVTHVIDDSGSLNATNVKGQVMIARAGNSMENAVDRAIKQESFFLDIQRFKLDGGSEYLRPHSSDPEAATAAQRAAHSGIERRQWAELSDSAVYSIDFLHLKLAKALALTLFELHSVDRVHRSFHPDILLFYEQIPHGAVHFDWSSPSLVGFDSSRSNSRIPGGQIAKTPLASSILIVNFRIINGTKKRTTSVRWVLCFSKSVC